MANTKKVKNNIRKSNKSELNLNVINQANDKQFIIKAVIIPVNGKDYEVEVSQVFRTTKIEKMINGLIKSDNLKQFGDLDESVKLSYYMFLIIREFTNLDIPNNLKLNEELNLINSLIDLGIFESIMQEIPESEITKINDYLQKFNMNLNKFMEDDQITNELKDVTKNKIVLDSVDLIESDDENGR